MLEFKFSFFFFSFFKKNICFVFFEQTLYTFYITKVQASQQPSLLSWLYLNAAELFFFPFHSLGKNQVSVVLCHIDCVREIYKVTFIAYPPLHASGLLHPLSCVPRHCVEQDVIWQSTSWGTLSCSCILHWHCSTWQWAGRADLIYFLKAMKTAQRALSCG